MAVIDLDVAPMAASSGRRRARRRHRAAPALVVAAALLLGGGAAPVERPWDRSAVLDGVPPGRMLLADDTLYLARPGGVVTAHHAGGGQRWSAPLGAAELYYAKAAGGLTVLAGHAAGAEAGMFVVAVEAATGVSRWRRDGTVSLTDRAAGLVVLAEPPPPSSEAAGAPRSSYRLLELATGKEVWLWGARPAGETLVPVAGDSGDLAGLLQRDVSGRTLLLDAATRQRRALADRPRVVQAFRSGDDLLVLAGDGTGAELVGYDWTTLRPRWRAGGLARPLGRCGPWFCVDGGDGTVALDPATGQVRWRRPGMPGVLGEPLVLHVHGVPAGRLSVVEPASGRPLLDLAGWTGIGGPGAGWQVAARWGADGRNHLVAVELASREIHPVATVAVDAESCASSGRLLACRTGPGKLTMWWLG